MKLPVTGSSVVGQRTGPTCPICGRASITVKTPHGSRHNCCGLHSWHHKALVGQEVHKARIDFHDAFDQVWRGGACKRGRAYAYLSHLAGLPESECHGATQTDLGILQMLRVIALSMSANMVNDWWRKQRACHAS